MSRISASIETMRDYFARVSENRMAQAQTLRQPDQPIKTIAMIGATTDAANEALLSLYDERFLYATVDALLKQGIALAPDFNIEVVNLDPAHGGRNYLEEATACDLAVFCFIYNLPETSLSAGKPEFGVAARHFERNIWHDTAARSGARFLSVLIGDQSSVYDSGLRDLGPGHFLPGNGAFEQINNHDYATPQTLLKRRDYQF